MCNSIALRLEGAMVMTSALVSEMVGSSAHDPETISGVNERFAGVRVGSKFSSQEKNITIVKTNIIRNSNSPTSVEERAN